MAKQCLGCMELYDDKVDICPHCGYIEGTQAEESIHMNPGTLLMDRYIIGKVLGYGGFGVTYIAWDKLLEQKVAIKEYLPGEFSTRMPGETAVTIFSGDRNEQFTEGLIKFVEEAKRLSKFQNEQGIVKIFDSFQANDTAYIVMEYLDGETLETYLQKEGQVSEDKAIEMLLPILNSLQVVHKEGILHRDIAPENIFITKDGDVKLIDFGASRYATTLHSRSLTVIIKPGYSPEEQYRSRGDQGPHTDIYALAATMYKMVTGVTPPDALERRALIETKKKDLLKDIHKVNKGVSRNVENAILNAMNVQIEDRTPDIESFVGELNSETPVKRRYGKIKKTDVYSWPLWLKITAPSLFVTLAVTGVLLITGVIDFPSLFSDKVVVPEGMVVVPELEGMDKDVALEKITKLGLKPSPEGNVESAYIEAGKIVLQKPRGGSYLNKGGKVVLTVSSGASVVGPVNGISTVPYVVWDTEANAIAKLQKAGLKARIETAYDDNVAQGKVISQGLKANNKVKEGTEITIILSLGREGEATQQPSVQQFLGQQVYDNSMSTKVIVPNVIGSKVLGESFEIGNVGLKQKIVVQYSDTIEPETVFKQIPEAGSAVERGTEVVLYISGGRDPHKYPDEYYKYTVSNGKAIITGLHKTLYGDVTLPSTLGGATVTEINEESFVLKYNVNEGGWSGNPCCFTSVVIPDGIVSIKWRAFEFCPYVKSITISKTVTNIEGWAFRGCDSVKKIIIDPQNPKYHAQGNCIIDTRDKKIIHGFSSSVIPSDGSVTTIGNMAFSAVQGIESIVIPDCITEIERSAFDQCHDLQNVVIGKGITTIRGSAFSRCNFEKIIIPNHITTIEEDAFWGNNKLKSVSIPDSVISISERAFYHCDSLTTIYFESEAQKNKFMYLFDSKVNLVVQ